MFVLNETVKNLPPSGIRKFFDLVISAGPDVISLGVGEPDFPAPWHIRESVIFALEKGFTSYSENGGLLELREEISKKIYKQTKKKYCPKSEILVTNGVSEGVDLALRSILNPNDIVLVPDPGYVMYKPLVQLAGGKCEYYDPTNIFDIKVNKNTKALVLNFPGNPIGNIFTKKELEFLADLVKKNNLIVISDEIYSYLSFVEKHISFIEIADMFERTLLFDGLSKSHSMTGFRIGWVCGPKELIGALTKIHQYAALCAPTPSQVGAIEAIRRGENEAKLMKQKFDQRRKFCIKKLEEIGIPFHFPKGAFYIFVNISGSKMDDVTFCEKLLKEQNLAIVPGSAFGTKGKGYVRMTYAESTKNLELALERLSKFWKKLNI